MQHVHFLRSLFFSILYGPLWLFCMEIQPNKALQTVAKIQEAYYEKISSEKGYTESIYDEYCDSLNKTVENAALTDMEKLSYCLGAKYYEKRKELTKQVIANNPNGNYNNKLFKTVLEEAVSHDDAIYVFYLLNSRVTPNFKTVSAMLQKPSTYSSSLSLIQFPIIEGIPYRKDDFGGIFPLLTNMFSDEQLTQRLSAFVHALKDKEQKKYFIIQLPHENAAALPFILKAGFEYYTGNQTLTELIFRNGSSIPSAFTSNYGAHVLIIKDDHILIIKEATRPTVVSFPGGTGDLREKVRETAKRELKEEVDLDVQKNDLQLIALAQRTKTNRNDANATDFYYMVNAKKVIGEINPDNYEIARAFYAPLATLAAGKLVEGLQPYLLIQKIAEHILLKKTTGSHFVIPDHRHLGDNLLQDVELFPIMREKL